MSNELDNPWNEPLPESEIERVKSLKDIQVIFDVGARTSLDYLDIFPDAEYHLFEPYPPFYTYLQKVTAHNPKIHVNPYGLGNAEEIKHYDIKMQSFAFKESDGSSGADLPLSTLNKYIHDNNIKRIDFLKIDTEKYDYLVLQGGNEAIGMARYIQYETWNEPENYIMSEMLKHKYTCEDIGLRNMFCTLNE